MYQKKKFVNRVGFYFQQSLNGKIIKKMFEYFRENKFSEKYVCEFVLMNGMQIENKIMKNKT